VPRHAEMDKEVSPALERENQILPAPPYGGYSLALELGRDRLGRLRTSKSRVDDLDVLETPTLEPRSQSRADCLDLGKLGHRRPPSGDDVDHDRHLSGPLHPDAVSPADFCCGCVGRLFRAGVDLGDDVADSDLVAALRDAEDADGMIDLVLLAEPSCAEAERCLADCGRRDALDIACLRRMDDPSNRCARKCVE